MATKGNRIAKYLKHDEDEVHENVVANGLHFPHP